MPDSTIAAPQKAHKNARCDLTAEYVRSILDYDPGTGVFRWKERADVLPTWNTRYAGTVINNHDPIGRIRIGINYKRYLAHRIAWLIVTGAWPEYEVDHIDGHPQNNQWENLRAATSSENLCNRGAPRSNTSGHKGVSWSTANNGWISRITRKGKVYHLGTFTSKESAREARVNSEKLVHGKFSRL